MQKNQLILFTSFEFVPAVDTGTTKTVGQIYTKTGLEPVSPYCDVALLT